MEQEKTMDIVKAIAPYLEDLGRKAPSYGSIGIDLFFHDGRIAKVEKRMSITMKPEH